jgi:hypothetical protein
MNNEPVAIRYDFDGYGYQYMDSGSGSDWQTRVKGELLYADHPACKHGVDDGACKECYQDATEPVALTQVEIMNALTLGIPLYTYPAKEGDEDFDAICLENKRLQAEIEKLRSWVEMLVEVPFFNEIDHYRGIPVAILRKSQEKC